MRWMMLTVLFGVSALSPASRAQAAPEVPDLIRLAEARRLADTVQDAVWPGWGATAFPVLLVTDETEFLAGYPETPQGFTAEGYSTLLGAEIAGRPRQFAPRLLATFPAFGRQPVIVIGRPEVTGKASTEWVLTVLHEHFHQLQMSDPGYYPEVNGLDLAGDDTSGMWMLNYPFPYESPEVAGGFAELSRRLAGHLRGSSPAERESFWESYDDFLGTLGEKDRRYLRFQVWQEGVARYVELRAAEAAAEAFRPSVEFRALPDGLAFSEVADRIRAAVLEELDNPNLQERQRVSFYAFGAGLALLLDQDGAAWKGRYLKEKFSLERYHEAG